MNLLYTLTAYPPSTGGAQLLQHLLAQEMRKAHNVQVISHWKENRTDWLLGTTLRAPSIAEDYVIDGIDVHRIGMDNAAKMHLLPAVLSYYPAMRYALPQIAAPIEKSIDAYAKTADIIHNVRIGREALSYASYQVARRDGIPFVLTPVHHPRWVGWRYRAFIKLYCQSDAIIALTHAEKRTLISLGVDAAKIHVTGMGPVLAPSADAEGFYRAYNIDGPFVLFLGQHYPYKGYLQLLESTSAVWRKHPDAHFVFVGPPVDSSESAFARFQDRRIHRLGSVDLQTKTDALAACSLLCLPSTQESFGGAYTEAWSFKRPVIGCNIPAVSEVIFDGEDGFLVEQSADQIADRITYLLANREHADELGAAGYRKVAENYTWPKLASQTEKIYTQLLS